ATNRLQQAGGNAVDLFRDHCRSLLGSAFQCAIVVADSVARHSVIRHLAARAATRGGLLVADCAVVAGAAIVRSLAKAFPSPRLCGGRAGWGPNARRVR